MKFDESRVRDLVNIITRYTIKNVTTSEARNNFKGILENTKESNYIIGHYNDPRAVLVNVEMFEAMRKLALMAAAGLYEQSRLDSPQEEDLDDTEMSPEQFDEFLKDAIREGRETQKRTRRFRRRESAAVH